MDLLDNARLHSLTSRLESREDFVFLDCSRETVHDGRSLLFLDPLVWLRCHTTDDARAFLEEAEQYRRQGYVLAGWFAYEFGYLLEPRLRRCLDGARDAFLAVLGVFRNPVPLLDFMGSRQQPERSSYRITALRPSLDRETFLRDLTVIHDYILAGDTYQVNYTFGLDFRFQGSPAALYRALRRNQSVRYGGWIRYQGQDIMSFSPELFFRVQGNQVEVCPMKGTLGRGRTLAEDFRRRRQLQTDEKCRSENVMIVDLLRNDLGHLLHDTGEGQVEPVSLFDVEPYETLLQMTSTIRGTTKPDGCLGLPELFSALFPCGSVTGAPKIRTMEIIHELEKSPRGVYCGAIGFAGPERSVFNVPIRTLVLEGEQGHMGIGAGIVHDSDPENEWHECLLKGGFLSTIRDSFQLIETLRWQPEQGYLFLEEHMERLRDSATYFLFRFNEREIRHHLHGLAAGFVDEPMRVRLLLHKDGRLELSCREMSGSPPPVLQAVDSGKVVARVGFSSECMDPDDVFLYHKTTVRRIYDSAYREAVEQGLAEVFFRNTRGEVTEGSISNIFILSSAGDALLTPPVSSGLLAGTLRRFLLERGVAREQVLRPSDLERARAVFMGNSVRGLVRVALARPTRLQARSQEPEQGE